MECKICGKIFEKYGSLSVHINKLHKITVEQYSNDYLNTKQTYCLLCGKPNHFRSLKFGYHKFCSNECQIKGCSKNQIYRYILKGMTEEDALKEVSKFQSECGKKAQQHILPEHINTKIEYWLKKGYTEQEAKEQISKRQNTCSLESFQNRYGKEEGLKRYNQRLTRFSKTYNDKDKLTKEKENKSRGRTFKQLIEQFGEDKANKIMDMRLSNFSMVSNLEKEILNKVKEKFKVRTQYRIVYNNQNYFYDGQVDNVLIEVQGSYWHADQRIYNENDIVRDNKTAKEIWQYDEYKKFIAEQHNFKILYIFEYDYIQNKKETIDKLINEIYQFRNN